jgi:hypothetical protein
MLVDGQEQRRERDQRDLRTRMMWTLTNNACLMEGCAAQA